jgi:putative transposase
VVEELSPVQSPDAPIRCEKSGLSQARRFLRKLSAVERARGRMGPNALKSVRAFTRRSTADLAPCDVYISDGHTFDAEIAHPGHGQPCRREVTTVLDVATRLVVGWSAALAESTWAVADALRHACESHGIPAIYYADHGPGQENKVLCAMLARLGIREERSIARNSQARGVIERFNQTLVAAAKRLPTYMGAPMDQDAKGLVYKLTRRELRLVGTSRLLLPWDDFLAFVETAIAAYNARTHRALGKRTSPIEAWQNALRDGFEPLLPSADEAAELFRPYETRKTLRGEIALHGKRYFARHLEHVHGEDVMVGYDIHDPSRVWVRDLEDRLLAIAELDGNTHPYFPLSRIEQAREDRARAQLRRLQEKAVRLTSPPTPIEGRRTPITVLIDRLATASRGRKAPPGEGRQKIWQALRSRTAAWSTPELVMTTGAEKRSVNLYVAALQQAGYVEIVSAAGPGDAEPAYYRLTRDTGPRAPVRRRDGTMFDRNSEQIAEPKPGERARPRLVA